MALERVDANANANANANQEMAQEPPRGATVDVVHRRAIGGQVRAPGWLSSDGLVTALLHRDDLIGMTPGDHALFFAGSAPVAGVDVWLLPDSPRPVDASTVEVRFRLVGEARGATASGRHGRVVDVGLLQIAPYPRDVLTVPASAVLYTAGGPYVLAASGDGGRFTKRPVEIGTIVDSSYASSVTGGNAGTIVVLSGLEDGDRVIAGNAFFVDAERRLRVARGQGEEATP
jgi:hypothetical protein